MKNEHPWPSAISENVSKQSDLEAFRKFPKGGGGLMDSSCEYGRHDPIYRQHNGEGILEHGLTVWEYLIVGLVVAVE